MSKVEKLLPFSCANCLNHNPFSSEEQFKEAMRIGWLDGWCAIQNKATHHEDHCDKFKHWISFEDRKKEWEQTFGEPYPYDKNNKHIEL